MIFFFHSFQIWTRTTRTPSLHSVSSHTTLLQINIKCILSLVGAAAAWRWVLLTRWWSHTVPPHREVTAQSDSAFFSSDFIICVSRILFTSDPTDLQCDITLMEPDSMDKKRFTLPVVRVKNKTKIRSNLIPVHLLSSMVRFMVISSYMDDDLPVGQETLHIYLLYSQNYWTLCPLAARQSKAL